MDNLFFGLNGNGPYFQKKENAMTEEPKVEAIVKRQSDQLLADPKDMRTLAQDLVNSQMFPNAKSVPGVIAIIQAGFELGIPPVAALNTMSVINGRLALEAKALLAIAQKKAGVSWKVLKEDDTGCEMEFARPGFSPINVTFTEKEAKEAGLLGKQNWKTYKRDMYFARCASRGVRRIAPDAVLGMYSREEMMDIPSNRQEPENARRVVQPPPSSSSGKQENVDSGAKNGISAGGPGFFGEEEPIIDAEPVVPGQEEPTSDDGFFQDEKGFKPVTVKAPEPLAEPPLFSDDAQDGLISAIKECLRVEAVDEREFRAFLYEYGARLKPPRKYVGYLGKNLRFHEGDMVDLKKLHGEIQSAIKTYFRWKKEQGK